MPVLKKQKGPLKAWRVLKSRIIVNSRFCKVTQEKVITSRGRVISKYFLVSRKDVAMIIPVTKSGKFVLIKEYKHGIKEQILMFPAGLVEEKENPRRTALRELREETGYKTNKIKFLGTLYEFPSNDTHRVYVYLAKNLPEAPIETLRQEEEIELIFLKDNNLKELILRNKLQLGTAVAAYTMAKQYL